MALSIAKKLYIEVINDSNDVKLVVEQCTRMYIFRTGTDARGSMQ